MRDVSRCLGACRLLGCGRSGAPRRSLLLSRALTGRDDQIPPPRRQGFPYAGYQFGRFTGFLSNSPSPVRELGFKGYAYSTAASELPVNGGAGKKDQKGVVKKESTEPQLTDVKILRNLAKYLWLQDNLEFRFRIVMALGLLIGAKVINVQVPFFFKLAVDWLSAVSGSSSALASFTEANSTALALFASPAAVLIGYGIARTGASACNELRNAVFSKVALRAIRTVSREI